MSDDKVTLYNITQKIEAIETLFEEQGGELTPELEALQAEVEAMLESKTDSALGFLSMQEDKLELAKNKIKEMQEFKKSIENKIARFKEYLLVCVERTERNEICGQLSKIKMRKPSTIVKITSEDKIPMEYLVKKTTIEPDKKGLLSALKRGDKIAGCEMAEGKKSLSITFNR